MRRRLGGGCGNLQLDITGEVGEGQAGGREGRKGRGGNRSVAGIQRTEARTQVVSKMDRKEARRI